MVSLVVWGVVVVVLIAVLYFIFRRRRPAIAAATGGYYAGYQANNPTWRQRAGAALPHVWRFTGLRFITFLILVFLIFAMEIGWLDVVGADFYGNVVISLLFIISFFALAIGRGRGGLERLIGWISLVFGVVGIAVFLQDWFSVIPFLDILVGNIVFVYIGPGSWVRIAFIIIVLFYLLMRGHPSYNRPLAI